MKELSIQTATSFVPAETSARWTKGLLVATILLSLIGIICGLVEFELLSRIATGGAFSKAEAAASDSRQQLIVVLRLGLYLGTAIAFLTWFHRVHENLPVLGGRALLYTPGWAVGGFFIPFLNLVRPVQVMREVWHGSDPSGLARDVTSGGLERNQLGESPLVSWWWILFLASSILHNLVGRLASASDQTLDQIRTVNGLGVFSNALTVPSALLAIRLVGRITSWQTEREEAIERKAAKSWSLQLSDWLHRPQDKED